MSDLIDTLLRGPRACPACGESNLRRQTYCHACGERIRNRNPLVRLAVTLVAIGVVVGVLWYRLKR